MDSFKLVHASRDLQNAHIDACVRFLRSKWFSKEAGYIWIIENAPGSRASEIEVYLQDKAGSLVIAEYGADHRFGVPKRQPDTERMINRMRTLLQTDCISFAQEMGTYGETLSEQGQASRVLAIQNMVCDQLLAFERDDTGKISGKKGGSARDDLGVAIMMAEWKRVFDEDPRGVYFKFKKMFPAPRFNQMSG